MRETTRTYEIDGAEGMRQLARILERQGYYVPSGVSRNLERGHILGYDSSGHSINLGFIDRGLVTAYTNKKQGRELAKFLEELDLVGLVEQRQKEFNKRAKQRSFPTVVITLNGFS